MPLQTFASGEFALGIFHSGGKLITAPQLLGSTEAGIQTQVSLISFYFCWTSFTREAASRAGDVTQMVECFLSIHDSRVPALVPHKLAAYAYHPRIWG